MFIASWPKFENLCPHICFWEIERLHCYRVTDMLSHYWFDHVSRIVFDNYGSNLISLSKFLLNYHTHLISTAFIFSIGFFWQKSLYTFPSSLFYSIYSRLEQFNFKILIFRRKFIHCERNFIVKCDLLSKDLVVEILKCPIGFLLILLKVEHSAHFRVVYMLSIGINLIVISRLWYPENLLRNFGWTHTHFIDHSSSPVFSLFFSSKCSKIFSFPNRKHERHTWI